MSKRIVSIGHLGNYYVAVKPILKLFADEIIIPPRISRYTLEIGNKYSPESACIPFKYTLGNFIEALDKGANLLIQLGGGCRMGYYGEVQRHILKNLGYEFEFMKLTNNTNIIRIAQDIKQLVPSLSYWTIAKQIYLAFRKAAAIDVIEEIMRLNMGFEMQQGSHERLFKAYLSKLDHAETLRDVNELLAVFQKRFASLPLNKPENPIRIGVVGEIYVVMEPFSNFFIEKEMANYGVEVHRHLSATEFIVNNLNIQKRIKDAVEASKPYSQHYLGGHGTGSVELAIKFAREGFAGLIHVKPFGCMPEINAMPALHNISRDFNFPILYFSFDTLTSETGIKTRLEAFHDMLMMREDAHVR